MPYRTRSGIVFLLSAATLGAACIGKSDQAGESLAVQVSVDAQECLVSSKTVSCFDLPDYLEQTLRVPKTTTIVLDDAKIGRQDNAVSLLARKIQESGYSQVIFSASIIVEPR